MRPASAIVVLVVALLAGWASSASALHVVSDEIPDGALQVPAGGRATLYLDINPNDFLQWTWTEKSGHGSELATELVWTDNAGQVHRGGLMPAGQISGNFDAPKDLMGARIEWNNAGDTPRVVVWSYYTTASFWKRPEYFLPAMLPLFLIAAAFYFGRMIDRRRRTAGVDHIARIGST